MCVPNFLFLHAIGKFQLIDELDVVGQALASIIKLHENPRATSIDLILQNKGFLTAGVIEDTLAQVGDDFLVQIELFDKVAKHSNFKRRRFFVIFLVEDIQLFKKQIIGMSHAHFHFNGYFVVITRDPATNDIESVFKAFWDKFIFNVNMIVKAKSAPKASLFTFLPFTGGLCGNVTPIRINEFNGEAAQWKSDVFFTKKFKNLQKCAIRVGSFHSPPETIITSLANGSKVPSGTTIDIIKGFATALNFSIEFKAIEAFTSNFSKNIDIQAGTNSLQESRMLILSETRLLFINQIILVIPPALLIGPIEKLFLPFDFYTWIALLLTLVLACVVVSVVLLSSTKYRTLIIGRHAKHDYLNIWNILLGGGQSLVPEGNFARFLLMSFVLLCLVIRNAYTGSLFNIMKNDINSREIKSINELNEKGYTFYLYRALADRLKNESLLRRLEFISKIL